MTLKNKRPWGYFEVLSETSDHKVKRIVVEPSGILSLQRHKLRSEHWFVVAGFGVAIVDGKNLYAREAHWIFPKNQNTASRILQTKILLS
jgi:mannose-6-phosphate isomerase-like protein (cupin superfamily)